MTAEDAEERRAFNQLSQLRVPLRTPRLNSLCDYSESHVMSILYTGINCDFRSLRLCAFASLCSRFNAKAQRRRDAKGVISVVTSFVLLHLRLPLMQKSSFCGDCSGLGA